MELSTKIRQARAKLNLTAKEAAATWGVNPRTLEDYEQGRRKPRGFAQKALNDLLDALLEAKPASASSEPPASPDGPGTTPLPPAASSKQKRRRRLRSSRPPSARS